MEERKVLLESGVYTPDDVIISELERRIAQVCRQVVVGELMLSSCHLPG